MMRITRFKLSKLFSLIPTIPVKEIKRIKYALISLIWDIRVPNRMYRPDPIPMRILVPEINFGFYSSIYTFTTFKKVNLI